MIIREFDENKDQQETKDIGIYNQFRNRQSDASRYLVCDILMEMNTEDVAVLAAYFDNYGFLYGLGVLKNPVVVETSQGDTYVNHILFQYSVDSLEGKNNMTNINFYDPVLPNDLKRMEFDEKMDYIIQHDEINRKVWGSKGFYMEKDFPKKSLSGDDLACRIFKNQVKQTAKKYDFVSMVKEMQEKEEKFSVDWYERDIIE